eukprot:260188-Hanusia_phi.AAC.7
MQSHICPAVSPDLMLHCRAVPEAVERFSYLDKVTCRICQRKRVEQVFGIRKRGRRRRRRRREEDEEEDDDDEEEEEQGRYICRYSHLAGTRGQRRGKRRGGGSGEERGVSKRGGGHGKRSTFLSITRPNASAHEDVQVMLNLRPHQPLQATASKFTHDVVLHESLVLTRQVKPFALSTRTRDSH